MTPIRLYPLYCTLYYCKLTLTLTCRQPSAPVALSFAFVSDFVSKSRSVHSIDYNFHSTFALAISFRNQQFLFKFIFLLEVSRKTTTLDFEHVTRYLYFSLFSCAVATLFALTFLCVSHSSLQLIMFCSKLATPLTLPTFSKLANMSCDDLTSPVAAAATAQVKLCPYNEEEPHLVPPHWGQVCSGRNQITKTQICQCSCQPAQASPLGHLGYSRCL